MIIDLDYELYTKQLIKIISYILIFGIQTSMNQIQKKPRDYDMDEQQSQDIGDLQQENSFEGQNKIFELNSAINTLQIEKNKLALEHQASLIGLQNKNQQLTLQNNSYRRQTIKYQSAIRKLEQENQQLKNENSNLKSQLLNIKTSTANYRQTTTNSTNAQHSPQFLNELYLKDKKIQQLNKRIEILNEKAGLNQVSHQKNEQIEKQKYQYEIKTLKKSIQDLKKKQIQYKRQYEGMLQSKQQIIKKMSNQNDEYSRKIVQSKDKIIAELRKQHEQMEKKLEQYRNEMIALTQKLAKNQKQVSKLKNQTKIRQDKYKYELQSEKQDLIRGTNQRLKKQLKDKDEKLAISQQKSYDLESQIMILKQQLFKQRAQVSSLNQFNNYLQSSNKQYEDAKIKLQTNLYEKQKQIGQLRQSYFQQITELKKTILQQRAQIDQKVVILQQQLVAKNIVIQKYEIQVAQWQKRQQFKQKQKQQQVNAQKELERIMKQKNQLLSDYEALEYKYKQKSDKLATVEKRVKKQYQQRIQNLQAQLIKNHTKQNQHATDQDLKGQVITRQQLQKLIKENQIRKIDLEEKQRQYRKLYEDKNKIQRENTKVKQELSIIERKMKQKNEQNRNLELALDQQKQKHKKTIKELQSNFDDISEQYNDQKRKNQRKKAYALQNENNLNSELDQFRKKVKQLEQQIKGYRDKLEGTDFKDMKIQKLEQQIVKINRQRQSAINDSEIKNKQKQNLLLEQKNKLLQYIEQLEQNSQILNRKLSQLQGKERKNVGNTQKQLRDVKLQYSQTLKQTNLVYQKYKKLEEVHKNTLNSLQSLKEEKESLNIKYLNIYQEKSKILEELNSAYDQINKLNIVLMSKQEAINRSKTINCPHYESKTNTKQYSQLNEYSRLSSNIGLMQTKTPPKSYDREYYNNQSSKYSRYG